MNIDELTYEDITALFSKITVLEGGFGSFGDDKFHVRLSLNEIQMSKRVHPTQIESMEITAIHQQAPETKPEPKTAISTREFLSILADKDAEIEVLAQTAIFAGGTDINTCNTARANYSMALSERAEFIGSFELVAKEGK